jgi:hypothetical protein
MIKCEINYKFQGKKLVYFKKHSDVPKVNEWCDWNNTYNDSRGADKILDITIIN